MQDVFISYSRKDTETANTICSFLEKAGISYFIDRQGIIGGAEFPDVLAEAISNSSIFLFLASKNSYASKYTKKEIHFAFNLKTNIILLPYIIDDSTLPAGLQFTFADINIRTIQEHPIETVLIPDLLHLLGRKVASKAKKKKPYNENKQKLLEQIKRAPFIDLDKLLQLIHVYDDLSPEDFRGYISNAQLEQLFKALRNPQEAADGSLEQENNQELATPKNESSEWEEIKQSGDIFTVKLFQENHPDSPFIEEVNNVYDQLRSEKLAEMKEDPSYFTKDDIEQLTNSNIFTLDHLMNEGLITEESWIQTQFDRDLLPNLQDDMLDVGPDFQSPQNSTDIFFFGTPGAGGKTCLLMSLAGNNGKGFFLDTTGNSGKYAADLSQLYHEGIIPDRTFGGYCAAIHSTISKGKRNHPVNFIEMSGEEFSFHLSEDPEVSLQKLNTPVCNLLRNNNRKIFFLHFDPIKDYVKGHYVEEIRNSDGEIIDERVRTKLFSQKLYLPMFLSKLLKPENAEIMRKVDAIHILVTKADLLGERREREKKAEEVIKEKYESLREGIKHCCNQYGIRNIPQIIPFSIGTFYLGNVFKSDPTDTLALIDIIKDDIEATEKLPFWKRIINL